MGPENILLADACIHFTCFGSEGVKLPQTIHLPIVVSLVIRVTSVESYYFPLLILGWQLGQRNFVQRTCNLAYIRAQIHM